MHAAQDPELVQLRNERCRGPASSSAWPWKFDHIETLKQAVLAGLGVAFISMHAIRSEVATQRLHALRVKGVRIVRHFHVIHNQARSVTASGRAFVTLLERTRAPFGSTRTPLRLDEPLIATED